MGMAVQDHSPLQVQTAHFVSALDQATAMTVKLDMGSHAHSVSNIEILGEAREGTVSGPQPQSLTARQQMFWVYGQGDIQSLICMDVAIPHLRSNLG